MGCWKRLIHSWQVALLSVAATVTIDVSVKKKPNSSSSDLYQFQIVGPVNLPLYNEWKPRPSMSIAWKRALRSSRNLNIHAKQHRTFIIFESNPPGTCSRFRVTCSSRRAHCGGATSYDCDQSSKYYVAWNVCISSKCIPAIVVHYFICKSYYIVPWHNHKNNHPTP